MSAASSANAPRRVRWSVPTADVSVNRWLDLQDSISESVRLLIRESIQREGYVDVVNKPVEQLPRRGRPSVETSASPAAAEDANTSQVPQGSAAAADLEHDADEPDESATSSAQATVRSDPTEVTSAGRRPQTSIDDVMASTRR